MPSSIADGFIHACEKLAAQFRIRTLVIALQDPQTGEVKLVASPTAKEPLKAKAAEYFGLGDTTKLMEENQKLRTEMASMGGDTGWEA